MPTQCRTAALLDGGHHLQLSKAQVTMLALSPGRPVSAEDIRDLQQRALHDLTLLGRQNFQRADHLAQQVGGNLGVARGGIQLLVPH